MCERSAGARSRAGATGAGRGPHPAPAACSNSGGPRYEPDLAWPGPHAGAGLLKRPRPEGGPDMTEDDAARGLPTCPATYLLRDGVPVCTTCGAVIGGAAGDQIRHSTWHTTLRSTRSFPRSSLAPASGERQARRSRAPRRPARIRHDGPARPHQPEPVGPGGRRTGAEGPMALVAARCRQHADCAGCTKDRPGH